MVRHRPIISSVVLSGVVWSLKLWCVVWSSVVLSFAVLCWVALTLVSSCLELAFFLISCFVLRPSCLVFFVSFLFVLYGCAAGVVYICVRGGVWCGVFASFFFFLALFCSNSHSCPVRGAKELINRSISFDGNTYTANAYAKDSAKDEIQKDEG